MEKWYDNKQCNDCCNDKLDKLLESNIVERILFHYTCNNRSVVEIPISLSSVGFAPYSSPSFLHFLAMELSVKQCIIVHEHKRVTIVTVIQLCGSDLVGFPLPPISLKVVHTGILSCFSYIESIINYYWVLQRVKERERERERPLLSNQVALHNLCIRNGIVFHTLQEWKLHEPNSEPARTEISLAYNLLWSVQWKNLVVHKTYWMLLPPQQ